MANNLGSLVVSLGLDAVQFTRGLDKSEYQAQKWARNFATAVDGVRTAALANFAAIGTSVAVLNRQLNDIAGFQDLADKMGDTAEQAASLKTASDLSGVALDTVADASVKLTDALAKQDDASKGAGLALKAIGIEVDQFKKLGPADQMEAVAKALASFEDGAGKTAVAVQLFGRSGANLMPFLNDLADAGGRQVVLTQQQIDAADHYSKTLARLTGEVDNLVKSTAADAAPAMTQLVEILRDVVRYSNDGSDGINLLAGSLGIARTAMEAIVVIGSDVAFTFKTLGDTAGAYAAVSAALIRGDIAGAKAIGEAYREMSAERRKALDDFQSRVLAGSSDVKFSSSDQSDAEARRLGLLAAPRARLNFSSATTKTPNAKSGKDPILEANEREAAMLKLLADLRQKEIDTARQGAIEELAAIEQRNKAYQEWVQSLIDDTPTKQLEKQRETMQQLAEEYERGRFGAAGSAEAVKLYGETVSTYLGNVATGVKTANETADQAGSIFGGWLERAITDGGRLSDVIDGLIRDLALLAIRKAVIEPAARGIATWVGGLSFDGGGYTGSGTRSGGLDGKGGFAAILHPNETVIDHTKGQGMGGVTVVQNVSIDARGADAGVEARIQQAMRQAKAEAVAEVSARASRGGSYATSLGRA